MAAGWSDRYHFYRQGNFHFYPNQMVCEEEEEELLGTWEIEQGSMRLVTTSKVVILQTCNANGFATLISREITVLEEPAEREVGFIPFGTLEDDIYPSILLDGRQYWKFSDDPTRYGEEQFPDE